ncbi:MAG: hypothetical protein MPJ50_06960 [Pirellulales bacterium]|nr:hypothetical protein [Pirellulales bacterium]
MPLSERAKEIKRRRHRKSKIKDLEKKLAKASPSDKANIAEKIRRMTPGAEVILRRNELQDV